ncbi:hypothetical protein DFP72DRAFT_855703 [Ephemerocybe angulata]|uniref:Uncharacterized protein n=1 Tax=Ephemerocybe angulata TaxID=980116 RepID=A0A8H6LYS8_9AGAR|nr:hypothetical protein DFP72DRAFT_855703 [Tulosesus angulatus]
MYEFDLPANPRREGMLTNSRPITCLRQLQFHVSELATALKGSPALPARKLGTGEHGNLRFRIRATPSPGHRDLDDALSRQSPPTSARSNEEGKNRLSCRRCSPEGQTIRESVAPWVSYDTVQREGNECDESEGQWHRLRRLMNVHFLRTGCWFIFGTAGMAAGMTSLFHSGGGAWLRMLIAKLWVQKAL